MEGLESFDQGTMNWINTQAGRAPGLRPAVDALTWLGSLPVLTGVALLTLLALLTGRRFRAAGLVVLVFLGAYALTEATKNLVKRDRPNVAAAAGASRLPPPPAFPWLPGSNWSFPSGSALLAAAVYGTAALAATPYLPPGRARVLVLGAALLLVFLIGLSRLYLAAHYPTDVLAGWCAGLAWALLGHWLDVRWSAVKSP